VFSYIEKDKEAWGLAWDKVFEEAKEKGITEWKPSHRVGPNKDIYHGLLKLFTTKFDRYGPELEKLFVSMMAYDPKNRLSSAEVNRMAKALK